MNEKSKDKNKEVLLSEEQKKELEKRLEDFMKNPGKTYSWEEVKKAARKNG